MKLNVKVTQVQDGEKQSNKMKAEEAKTRKEFAKDGIDDAEKKILDGITGKINKVKDVIEKIRTNLTKDKKTWESRAKSYSKVKSDIDELQEWGHRRAAEFLPDYALVGEAVSAQCWIEAVDAVEQAMANLAPVYADYLLQVDAQAEYDPMRADFDTRSNAVIGSDPQSEAQESLSERLTDTGNMDASVEALDYITALATLKILMEDLEQGEELAAAMRESKDKFDPLWKAIHPKLAENSACVFPDLTPMQEEILTIEGKVEEYAQTHDYDSACGLLPDLETKLETYMVEFTKAVDARTLYESRLPGINAQLGDALVSEFPDLAAPQAEMDTISKTMQESAKAGDYEQALLNMDGAVPVLDAYSIAYEQACLKQEYDRLLADMLPRITETAVCNYTPAEGLSLEISADKDAAEVAATAGAYPNAIGLLEALGSKNDKYFKLVAEIETAKTTYDSRVANILARVDNINECEFKEVDDLTPNMISSRTQMEEAATAGDYPAGLKLWLCL